VNDPKRRYNLVRLDRRQREDLLRRLDGSGGGSRPIHRNRRSEPRWPFHVDDVAVRIDHLGGGRSEFIVLARNLSSNGLGFIHGGFVHPKAICQMDLETIDGDLMTIKGRVVSCRHVQGTLHEVGVKFDETIDPTLFLNLDVDEMTPDMLQAIKGSLLLVAESEIDAALIGHQLGATDITVTTMTSIEETLAARQPIFDIMIFDTSLAGSEPTAAVTQLHGAGLAASFVIVTAETGEARLKAALAAGADHVLPKPYEPKELYALLSRLLRRRAASRPEINLDAKDGLNEMLLQFIDHAEKMGRQLEAALDEQNLDQARSACVNLKGSATGYGYPALSDAASDILRSIDDTMSMESCLQEINGLSAMCKRLAQSGRPAAPGDDRTVQ
jgi:DNA-binding response OmpR family regulator